MELYPDEEDMEVVVLENEIEIHWSMVFDGNDGGVYDGREILHANRWNVYINKRCTMLNDGAR